jgi:hypothetical protein
MARTPLGVLGDFLLRLRWHSIEVLEVLGWEYRQALVNATKKDCLSIFPDVSCIFFSSLYLSRVALGKALPV